jgi:hypothetical protein
VHPVQCQLQLHQPGQQRLVGNPCTQHSIACCMTPGPPVELLWKILVYVGAGTCSGVLWFG